MNIWHVDDDQEMLQAMRLLLKLLGHTGRGFLKVRDAVKLLQYGEKPDLLMVDLNMPEVNGFDLIEYLRRQIGWHSLPIVVLSSEYQPPEIEHALALGADSYVCKPVMLDELEAAINKALEKHQEG